MQQVTTGQQINFLTAWRTQALSNGSAPARRRRGAAAQRGTWCGVEGLGGVACFVGGPGSRMAQRSRACELRAHKAAALQTAAGWAEVVALGQAREDGTDTSPPATTCTVVQAT